MKTTSHHNRKQRKRSAIKLLVESLEPRLVLSAIGFGGEREHFEFGDRDLDDVREFRFELNQSGHFNDDGSRRQHRNGFSHSVEERDDRFDHDREYDDDDHFNRRPGRHHDYADFDYDRHDDHYDRHDDDHDEPFAGFPTGEGEFGDFEDEREDDFGFGILNGSFDLPLLNNPPSPGSSIVLVSLQPTFNTPPPSSLDQLAPPLSANTPTQSQSAGQGITSASTLPVPTPSNLDTSNRTPTSSLTVDSSLDSLNLPSFESDAAIEVTIDQVEAAPKLTAPIFTSFKTSTIDSLSDIDGAIEVDAESAVEDFKFALHQASIDPVTNAGDSLFTVDALSFNDDSLWTTFADGGFIEIDLSDFDSTPTTIAADKNDGIAAEDDKQIDSHDAFWFEFDDANMDLLIKSLDVESLTSKQQRDELFGEMEEEAWLDDDGGMIVIATTSPCNENSTAIPDVIPTESDIPQVATKDSIRIRAEVSVFHAIDVASSLNNPDEKQSQDDEEIDRTSGKVAADAEEVVAPTKQAATNSDQPSSEPARAAALPWLAAIVALWESRRSKRNRDEEFDQL